MECYKANGSSQTVEDSRARSERPLEAAVRKLDFGDNAALLFTS